MITGIPLIRPAFDLAFQSPLSLKMGLTERCGMYLPYCTPSRLGADSDHQSAAPILRGRQLGEWHTRKHTFKGLCRLTASLDARYHIATEMQEYDVVSSETEASVQPARTRDDGYIGHTDVTATVVDRSDRSPSLASQKVVAAPRNRRPMCQQRMTTVKTWK